MKQVIIKATNFTPKVELNPEGKIIIKGRSLIEDQATFYTPIFRWVKSCTFNTLKVYIKLEHMNRTSSKQIFTLLTLIRENYSIKNVYIKWYYEEGDVETLEMGKEFESQINLPFDFLMCSETTIFK